MENKRLIKRALKTAIYYVEQSIKDIENMGSITDETRKNMIKHYESEILNYKKVMEELQ